MSLLNMNPASIGPNLTAVAAVGLIALVVGGLGGYKAGSAIMYQKEDKKVDQCVDTITQAERDTLNKLNSGQAVLTAVISDVSGKTADSEVARAKVLSDASASDAARRKLLASSTPAATPKVVIPRQSTPGQSTPGQPQATTPECPAVYAVPQSTIHVINQLLEISNETGLYSVPLPASSPTPVGLPDKP